MPWQVDPVIARVCAAPALCSPVCVISSSCVPGRSLALSQSAFLGFILPPAAATPTPMVSDAWNAGGSSGLGVLASSENKWGPWRGRACLADLGWVCRGQ